MADPFYLTTAIHYPNGRPHIGHAYETIAADVLARFYRQAGRDVRFQTGTDEHGLKMAQKARDLGVTPRELADEMSGYFRSLFDELDITYDRFIRTSEDEHHRASQAIWTAMERNGDLYLDRYEGWYSIRDEAYYDESELTDGEDGEKLSPQGTPVEWTVEESWFFRLSAYQDKLLSLFEENPDFIRPESRRNEVMRFVEGGLRDLSISRTSFDWGVKVPGAENHVMYVWVDALTNYLTGLGYPDETEDLAKFWPADLHLIGKDITRFHTVYWPAFLMSAGIDLPKQVFAHGFLLNRGQKESKSLGNVTDPGELAQLYGVDVLRYFLLREFSFGQDGSYSREAIVNRSNSELANSFGNLAQRTLSLIFKNCGGALPAVIGQDDVDEALMAHIDRVVRKEMPAAYTELAFAQALEAWMGAVSACNAYIDAAAPWALKKTDPERMEQVLATLYTCIAQLAVSVIPVMPGSMAKLLNAMGVENNLRDPQAIGSAWYPAMAQIGFTLEKPQGLFPRLDLPETEEDVA
ncbi:methionyl-tRNA synthetase [Aurantiacibacter atlanticus]|uniref:Methionine--tRNA ligase n=1 Tax=Aurantiacibacter atlanticus TaxID=1648404 RepID=A0A0H4VGW6_9SPHN|nr:methionine--tRNA ligase [Aurantiacibacter atlanticus]AKQ42299.1 methionyl-tRNA synthetase [Aurantiacibacter atlanticus]MDF1835045.1 methionine--tRNA ligase [Alteraurantiacibacter sp. bin_em_oilr2.035]